MMHADHPSMKSEISMVDKLRNLWERWGPVTTAITTTLLGLVGATYYVSQKIAALDGVQGLTSELRSSLGNQASTLTSIEMGLEARRASSEQLEHRMEAIGDQIGGMSQKVDRLVEITAMSGERIAALQGEQARQEKVSDEHRATLTEVLDRLARLESRQELLEALQRAEFGGATIELSDDTVEVYAPDEGEKFKKDAQELLKSGRAIRVAVRRWSMGGLGCVPGPGGCLEISFNKPPINGKAEEEYRISLHIPEDGESPDFATIRPEQASAHERSTTLCPSLRIAAFINERLLQSAQRR
jgi:hypothetical protein